MESNVKEQDIIVFKEGIPGFEHLTKFMILEEGNGIFYYLQSVEDKSITFPIVSPYVLMSEYNPNVDESYFEKLGGGTTEEFAVYTIVTVREPLEQSTLNLQGPLLIHVERRIGLQAIVEDKNYKTRHKIADLLKERGV